jgi:hypothetical protein
MDAPTFPDERGWVRGLRPIFYWLLLVLVLFGIRTHQRLMEKTLLNFSVSMQGQAIDATAAFDGKPAFSGQKIPLGNHTLVVTHPKGETFSTNLFIWYGEHNLGTIDLKRAKGILAVTADPPAPLLSIRGPEWSVTLTNSPGLTATVPTDQYTVESRYAHWERADDVSVFAGSTATWRIAPRLGAVQLSCNHSNATFQLLTLDNRQVEAGGCPSLITELPEGDYKLTSQHHGHERDQTLAVKAGVTNDNPVEFLYGAAVLETEPPDAAVQDGNGRIWGVTPLNLPELLPGTLKVTLHRGGYEPVLVLLEIAAKETATFRTNLISTSYTGGMKSTREFMAAADYGRALQAIGDVLIAKPDDAEAITLQREATGLGKLQHAKKLGAAGDYIGAGKELTLALQSLPDNAEAKQLLTDFKQHEPEQKERLQQERLAIPRQALPLAVKSSTYNRNEEKLFEEHELKASKPVAGMESAIMAALQAGSPAFQVRSKQLPWPDSFAITGRQELPGGLRQCVIVGAQTGENETYILFMVIEYKTKHDVSLGGGLTFNTSYIPLHPSQVGELTEKMKAQIAEGIQIVTARIQQAIGQ